MVCEKGITPAGNVPVSRKVREAPRVPARSGSSLLVIRSAPHSVVRSAPQSGRRPRRPRVRILLGRAAASGAGAGRAAAARSAH